MNNEVIKIKQMMPIPKGYEVMTKIQQEDGSVEMEAVRESVYPYCLALVDGGVGRDDHIELYCLEPGAGVEDHCESMLVPSKRCEKCGKWMTPRMHGIDEDTLYYTCDCEKTAAETEE